MQTKQQTKHIGTRPIRPDGVDKVTGRAAFGADLMMPGMIYGKVLRSPHAHAEIKSIDTSQVLKIPGVIAVVTGADFPDLAISDEASGEGGGAIHHTACNVIARDKVLYHGHAVAAVAAVSERVSQAALAAIKIDYKPLTPVMNLQQAMADDAPLLHQNLFTNGLPNPSDQPSNIAEHFEMARGDVDAGFAEADVVVEGEYTTPTVHQGYIEPHACVARIGEDDQVTIWCSTQGHFDVRNSVSKILGLNVGRIRVIPSEIGGGFGGKTTVYLEPLAVMLAKKSTRPVKMVMNRDEVFRASGPASASQSKVRIGAMKDGNITAMQIDFVFEAGAFPGGPVRPGAMAVFAPYDVPNFKIIGLDVVVNKPKVAAYRAPGAPQVMFATECLLDDLATKLNMDPIDLRLKNAVDEGMAAAYGPKFGPIGLRPCLEAAKQHPNYTNALAKGKGRGVAVGFWFNVGLQSSASVQVNQDGSITVIEGNPDIGGSRASMALMAAEELGIPYERVRVLVADTDSIGICDVTGGSRVTYATGMAVVAATKKVKHDLCQRAAKIWKIDPEQVEWQGGEAIPKPGVNDEITPLSLSDLALQAPRTGGPIGHQASLNARGPGPSFSVNIAEVTVDSETGQTTVLGFTSIQDAGRAIHPSYVEGQMQGGAAQGIGWALNEEYVWNEDGVMQNASFLDYRIPVASDLPMIDTQIIEVPNPGHPYGVRGVGETPIVAPLAAVSNAVKDATGVRIRDLPLSPNRVLDALDEANSSSS